MTRESFDEQATHAALLDQDIAISNFRERLAAGQVPLIRAFGFTGSDTTSLLWGETRGRALETDEIAHYFILTEDAVVGGLALWRQPDTRAETETEVE